MRIIDRYIVRETAIPFVLGLGVFTMILLVARILRLVELVLNRGVPFLEVAELFSYILPSFLEVTVPMALLLGVMVALGRLSTDSEVVAMRSCGISLAQIGRPIAAIAVAAFLVSLVLSLYARPWGNRHLREGLYEIARVRATAGIRPRIFNDDFSGLVLYVNSVEPPGNVLQGILISGDFDPADQVAGAGEVTALGDKTTVVAKAGVVVTNEATHTLRLRLFEGSLHTLDREQQTYQRTDFGSYDITLDMDAALTDLRSGELEPEEVPTEALLVASRRGGANDHLLAVELARRLSLPFACLGFAAIAIPLGIRPSSSARARSFAVSLALIFTYYLLLTLGESLAERKLLPTHIALWLPNLALFGLAAALFRRAATDVPTHSRAAATARRLGALLRRRGGGTSPAVPPP